MIAALSIGLVILIGGIDGDVPPGQQLGILRVYSKMMAIKSFTSKLLSRQTKWTYHKK